MDNTGKEGSFKILFLVMFLSLIIAYYWPSSVWIKNSVHAILDPTLGALLNLNLTFGMFLIIGMISLITALVQKYTTDQATIRDLKRQQKEINEKAKEFRHDPSKMMEIQKEIFPISSKLMKLSMRPIMFTGIPFILVFRWFMDTFNDLGNPKFFGILSWFWFYLIFTIILSGIIRKILKVV
jgi:uncharacterized membrane protein (DUF106 family)